MRGRTPEQQQAWEWHEEWRKARGIGWHDFAQAYFVAHVLGVYVVPFLTDEQCQRLATGRDHAERNIGVYAPGPFYQETLSIVRRESAILPYYRTHVMETRSAQILEDVAAGSSHPLTGVRSWMVMAVLGDNLELDPGWTFPGEIIQRLNPNITGHKSIIRGLTDTFKDIHLGTPKAYIRAGLADPMPPRYRRPR